MTQTDMPSNSFVFNSNSGETKEQILERLLRNNVITFVELMVLLGIRENSYQGPEYSWTSTGTNPFPFNTPVTVSNE